MKKDIAISIGCLLLLCSSGCLSYSHYKYSKRNLRGQTLSA